MNRLKGGLATGVVFTLIVHLIYIFAQCGKYSDDTSSITILGVTPTVIIFIICFALGFSQGLNKMQSDLSETRRRCENCGEFLPHFVASKNAWSRKRAVLKCKKCGKNLNKYGQVV